MLAAGLAVDPFDPSEPEGVVHPVDDRRIAFREYQDANLSRPVAHITPWLKWLYSGHFASDRPQTPSLCSRPIASGDARLTQEGMEP